MMNSNREISITEISSSIYVFICTASFAMILIGQRMGYYVGVIILVLLIFNKTRQIPILMFFLFAFPIMPEPYWKILLTAILGIYLLLQARNRNLIFKFQIVDILVLAFVTLNMLSLVANLSEGLTSSNFRVLLAIILNAFAFYATSVYVRDWNRLWAVINAIALLLLLESIFVAFQFLAPETFLYSKLHSYNLIGSSYDTYRGQISGLRAGGTSVGTNPFAVIMSLFILPFTTILKHSKIPKEKAIFIFLILVLVLSVLLSGTRAPLIGLLISFVIYSIIIYKKSFVRPLIFTLTFFIVLSVAYRYLPETVTSGNAIERLFRQDDFTSMYEGRMAMTNISFDFLLKQPFFGYGLRIWDTTTIMRSGHIHNQYMMYGYMSGFIALGVYLIFILGLFFKNISISFKNNQITPKHEFSLALKMIIFQVAIFNFSGGLETEPLYYGPFIWACFGIIRSSNQLSK